jgi:hypothetical protein
MLEVHVSERHHLWYNYSVTGQGRMFPTPRETSPTAPVLTNPLDDVHEFVKSFTLSKHLSRCNFTIRFHFRIFH